MRDVAEAGVRLGTLVARLIMQPTCANCGIPIGWEPTIVDGRAFCCVGCANGGPCNCDYSKLPHPGEMRAIYVRYGSEIVVRSCGVEQGGRSGLHAFPRKARE